MIENDSDDKFYAAIGKIAAEVAHIELTLTLFLGELLTDFGQISDSADDRIPFFITGENFTPLLDKVDKMLHYCATDKGLLGKFHLIREDLKFLNSDRNTYLHTYIWFMPPSYVDQDQKIHRFKIGRSNILDQKPVTLRELNSISLRAEHLRLKLDDFIDSHLGDIRQRWAKKVEEKYKRREKLK